jgi:pyruvate dehydrogenase E2 component (dihydrolipoamide acetyltransferase)
MSYYKNVENPSSFRKLAAAMWRAPNDPHIFGSIDVEMTKALEFIESYNAKNDCKVTVTHLVVRAAAILLARYPAYNAKVGWASIKQRTSVSIFCQVATNGGRDLSGYKIPDADRLSIAEIAATLGGAATDIREDKDPAFKRSRSLFQTLPLWGIRMVLGLMSFLTNKLSLHLPRLGMPRDPFGSAMVTSVGMLGIDTGYAPFTPIARCPMILTVTKVRPRPWVAGDRVVPRPVLRLCATFDHRVIDGVHAGQLSADMEAMFEDPTELLTDAERRAE